ncbi:uncharacterized protein LOC129336312 [Eublepharis macularius]|uniref:Uncharacterized protein LOC129336312 n=1 Tax=Eublepharis macularius TaxID=481883 RepID=A0AA97JU97_EUBMA|nr:uncharacterized protein LOC129336312 [Eublepharis macularius]
MQPVEVPQRKGSNKAKRGAARARHHDSRSPSSSPERSTSRRRRRSAKRRRTGRERGSHRRHHEDSDSDWTTDGEVLCTGSRGSTHPRSISGGAMAGWRDIVMQGVFSSVAPSTLKSYSAAQERFVAFTWGARGGALRPPSQEEVLRYLAHLRALGRAPRTTRHDLAAVVITIRRSKTDQRGPKKSVWICGHSIVHWAGKYAASSGWGRHLGLEDCLRIHWMGVRGMLWDSLLPLLVRQARRLGPPDALVIQLGENDLGKREGPDLQRAMCSDLVKLQGLFPQTALIWSDLLQRQVWRGARCPKKVDGIRQRVARALRRHVEETGGRFVAHWDISYRIAPLFSPDGVHLSSWGQDIWLQDLRDGLLGWCQQ